jgi:hypothetical protein
MVKLKFNVKILAITIVTLNLKLANSLCNLYPKIFGEDSYNTILNDIEIHEGTDTIVSGGAFNLPLASIYPIIIVSSLSTTEVKWAVTDYTLLNQLAYKLTISPNGKYIMTMIGEVGVEYRLIVFDTIGGNVLSQRRFSAGGIQQTFEMRALLINSAGTSGFVMDIQSGAGTRLLLKSL